VLTEVQDRIDKLIRFISWKGVDFQSKKKVIKELLLIKEYYAK